MKMEMKRGQNAINFLLLFIIIVAVAIPVVYDQITALNPNGTVKTILNVVPVALGVSALVGAFFMMRGKQ